jgi:DNA-binding LytR/AlgR family response regulator
MKNLVHVGSRTSVSAGDIVYLKAEINYTVLLLSNGKRLFVSYNLGKLHDRLSEFSDFVRPNRNMVINLRFITHYSSEILYLNKQAIQISRRRREIIQNSIQAHFNLAV